MNDIINKNESIFSRSSYNFENFKKNSHKRRIAKIHKFLSEEKKISEAFQIESALSYLNLERNSADYDEDKPYTIKLSKLIEIETKAVFEILYNLNQ